MPRHLPILLLGPLLVVATACSKKDPEPKLEDTWILASESQVLYDQSNVEIRRDVVSANEFRADITRDSIIYFRLVDTRRMLAYRYTRTGRDLTLDNGAVPHIEELTTNRMVWKHSRSLAYTSGRADFTMVFTR